MFLFVHCLQGFFSAAFVFAFFFGDAVDEDALVSAELSAVDCVASRMRMTSARSSLLNRRAFVLRRFRRFSKFLRSFETRFRAASISACSARNSSIFVESGFGAASPPALGVVSVSAVVADVVGATVVFETGTAVALAAPSSSTSPSHRASSRSDILCLRSQRGARL